MQSLQKHGTIYFKHSIRYMIIASEVKRRVYILVYPIYISFYMHIYENRRQCIKSLKMSVETSDENKFSYIYVLNPFLKLAGPTRTDPA